MVQLDHDTRQRLRHEVSDALRARLLPGGPRCSRCGCGWTDWTLGCSTCTNRHWAKARRGNYPNGKAWYDRRREEAVAYAQNARREANLRRQRA